MQEDENLLGHQTQKLQMCWIFGGTHFPLMDGIEAQNEVIVTSQQSQQCFLAICQIDRVVFDSWHDAKEAQM